MFEESLLDADPITIKTTVTSASTVAAYDSSHSGMLTKKSTAPAYIGWRTTA